MRVHFTLREPGNQNTIDDRIIAERNAAYTIEARREAFRTGTDRRYTEGWTEEEWITVSRHVDPLSGTLVYHSFSDFCD